MDIAWHTTGKSKDLLYLARGNYVLKNIPTKT